MLTLDLEEGRQQLKFVFLCRNGIRQLLAIVEWLEEGLETVVYQHHLECHRSISV